MTAPRRWSTVIAAVWVLSALPARPAPAQLADLVAEVFGVSVEIGDVEAGDVTEGCAGGQLNRRLLRYSLRTRNIGSGDLELGDPTCPVCSENPGAACGNPLFVCSTAHGHAHFEDFAVADLLDSNNVVVAQSHKYGFCLLDLECASPQYSCSFQGLSAGCSDVYSAGLPCQYIDLTDAVVPDGDYTLRVTLDPDGVIDEANEANNQLLVPITIGGPSPPCPTYAATDVPIAIPDSGAITSSITVPINALVTSVNVLNLHGTHTYVGDLLFQLTSPAATTVTLMNTCGSEQNFNLSLSDQASAAIECPATSGASYLPQEPLSAFAGELATGTWTLTVTDQVAQDSGTLDGWSLEICTELVCSTFTSSDVPKNVPDAGSVSSTLGVPPGSGPIETVSVVGLRGTHAYVGDLEVHLISPNGHEVNVMDRVCGSDQDFDLSLSDFASQTIPCPPTGGGNYLPSNSFAGYLGEAPEGTWTLTVFDRVQQDVGTLTDWGIKICQPEVLPTPTPTPSTAQCAPTPIAGCSTAGKSALRTRSGAASSRTKLDWRWSRGTIDLLALGDPTASTSYAVCLYADGMLASTLPLEVGGMCGDKPCWLENRAGSYRYYNAATNSVGMWRTALKAGTGNGRIVVRARGTNLTLPDVANTTRTVQLVKNPGSGPECWESVLPAP